MSSGPAHVFWHDDYLGYLRGCDHPMRPARLELTMALAGALGVLDAPGVQVLAPEPAGVAELHAVHDPAYVDAVQRVDDDPFGRHGLRFGLGTEDDPVFPRMHEVAARIAGGSLAAADAVADGRALHAANIGGGLHHAMSNRASGFCVYNDVALAIGRLLDRGMERVAYVDVDVHHGDGVQAAFWDDPRVLTISLHQDGATLFPGTGRSDETGGPHAEGGAVNVPLPPGTDDAGWLRAFSGVVPVLLRAFRPQALVTQHGCDSHALDPLADLALTVDGQRASYAALHDLAHELCGGRWVCLGGGGYGVVSVVPRAWTHLLALAGGVHLAPDTPLPEAWRAAARREATGEPTPETMTDGGSCRFRAWDAGEGDPDDRLDRAVAATRRAVLPLHGLDPMVDR